MAAWVDLSAIHDPSPGVRPPASWGDGLVTNLEALRGTAGAAVNTSETTTSTTFTDLATVGPAVTLDTGTSAIVFIAAQVSNSGANLSFMSVAVSGASSIAAAFDNVLMYHNGTSGAHHGSFGILTGLTAGTNIFTAKYSVGGGTGTWLRRKIAVIPLF